MPHWLVKKTSSYAARENKIIRYFLYFKIIIFIFFIIYLKSKWIFFIFFIIFVIGLLCFYCIKPIWLKRKASFPGSQLHRQMITVFTALVMGPAFFVAIFTVLYFHVGVQTWFNVRVQTAISEANTIANLYLEDKRNIIRESMKAMVDDLAAVIPRAIQEPELMANLLSGYRIAHEALLMSPSGGILARSHVAFGLELIALPENAFEKADQGIYVFEHQQGDRILALAKVSQEPRLYLLLGRFMDKRVLERVQHVHEASEAYQSLFQEKERFFYTSSGLFLVLSLLLVLLACLGGFQFADNLLYPLKALLNAATSVARGDFSIRLGWIKTPFQDLGRLIQTFNRMIQDLETQHQTLIRMNRDSQWRTIFMEHVLNGVSSGVISLQKNGNITLANPQAYRLLELPTEVQALNLFSLFPEWRLFFNQPLYDISPGIEQQISIKRHGLVQVFHLHVYPPPQKQASFQDWIVTIDDMTQWIEIERQAALKAALTDVAKRLAHEIKNPLTPIRLATEGLIPYAPESEEKKSVFLEFIAVVQRNSEHILNLISEFYDFAREPTQQCAWHLLSDFCGETLWLPKKAYPEIFWEIRNACPESAVWFCDKKQMNQAIYNLLKNAIESVIEKKQNQPSFQPMIALFVEIQDQSICLGVEDNGLGFSKTSLEGHSNSKKPGGMGLGMTIAHKIAQDHNTSFMWHSDHKTTRVWLELPRQAIRLSGEVNA